MDKNRKYLLICNTSDGLIAQVNGVVTQLQFARRMGLEPIVYLHGRSYMFGGPNPYFDPERGGNLWEYYFEPIGPSSADLNALVQEGRVVTLTCAAELERLYRWEPRSWFMNPYGYMRSVENRADGRYPAEWWNAEREKARIFLDDNTLAFQRSILAQVEAFAAKHFTGRTLGIQMRGSDKFDFGVGPNLSRKVEPAEYYPHIDRFLADHPDCNRIFIATDQRQWLREVQAKYPELAVGYSEMSLSESSENQFNATEEKAARGAEVLVDMLLLSRCDYLIKCHAAVGEMSLVVNRELDFLDLNYATQEQVAVPGATRFLAAPAIRAGAALWRFLAEHGLALEVVREINGDEVLVGRSRRSLNTKPNKTERAPRPPFGSKSFVSGLFEFLLRKCGEACFRYDRA